MWLKNNLGGNIMAENSVACESRFTGGAFANFGVNFAVNFVGLITLGLAYPAMKCWQMRWECEHTYYDGKQLSFDGTGGQYFGLFIKTMLLSLITLGIYYILCGSVALEKWRTKHTHFAGEEDIESEFDGKWYQLLGVNLLTGFVTMITLSFGIYWAHCYSVRWQYNHQTISGQRLNFDGKAMQYFGSCIKWALLTLITFGIYSFWMAVKTKNWTCKHTHILTGTAGSIEE